MKIKGINQGYFKGSELTPLFVAMYTLAGFTFDPASMFTPTTPGWVYDLSDFSTLFQDSAGTIPVTAVEQPVGLVLDKSGNGNHASQPTTTKQPVLSSRVNLLTYSEDFANAAWHKRGTCAVTSNSTTAPDGTQTADLISGVNTGQNDIFTFLEIPLLDGAALSVSVYIKKITASGSAAIQSVQGPLYGEWHVSLDALSTNWEHLSDSHPAVTVVTPFTGTGNVNSGPLFVGISGGPLSFYLWGAQTNYGTAQPYQRITTATNYDTAGFPLYLKGDGIDDFMSTADIDFTGTDKLAMWAGVTKLDDTARIVAELSESATANIGSFFLVSGTDGSYSQAYTSLSRGNGSVHAGQVAGYTGVPAPDIATLTITHDISGDLSTINRNGVAGVNGTFDKGTGNFGNYPMYFLARGGTGVFFNGQLYSNVCLGREATADELTKTQAWVAQKTGVTL